MFYFQIHFVYILHISCEIYYKWMPNDFIDGKAMLILVIALNLRQKSII